MDLNSRWLVEDVTFDEGAFFATEEHHMTILTIELPFQIPVFAIEKASLLDRILEYTGYREVDFVYWPDIAKDFDIKAPRDEDIRAFFDEGLLEFLRGYQLYHMESKGDAIMVFKYDRLAGAMEVYNMIKFGREFEKALRARTQDEPAVAVTEDSDPDPEDSPE